MLLLVTVQHKTSSTLHDYQRRHQLIMQASDGISSSNMQDDKQSRLCGHVIESCKHAEVGWARTQIVFRSRISVLAFVNIIGAGYSLQQG